MVQNYMVGGQHLERPNVERAIFRNFTNSHLTRFVRECPNFDANFDDEVKVLKVDKNI